MAAFESGGRTMTGDTIAMRIDAIIARTKGDIIAKIDDQSADMLNPVAARAKLWPPLQGISMIRV
jgi:hypothetical protein